MNARAARPIQQLGQICRLPPGDPGKNAGKIPENSKLIKISQFDPASTPNAFISIADPPKDGLTHPAAKQRNYGQAENAASLLHDQLLVLGAP
jgi:hypothetical protein